MLLPDGFRMRPADAADLPRIAALRSEVGWNVHDWVLRAVLEPPDALCVAVTDDDDRVVAVGSGISYGPLGAVGNMIVDPAFRRRGLGSAVLDAVSTFLEGRGCARLELYATADGRPLYARHGFEPTGPGGTARVTRHVALAPDARIRVRDAGPESVEAIAEFDVPRFGGDRSRVLRWLPVDAEGPFLVARLDGKIVGYAWLRPDEERLGPFVADGPGVAAAIVEAAFERQPAMASLRLNLPSGNGAGAAWLRDAEVPIDEWDGRMARGPQIPRRPEMIYGIVVGALG